MLVVYKRLLVAAVVDTSRWRVSGGKAREEAREQPHLTSVRTDLILRKVSAAGARQSQLRIFLIEWILQPSYRDPVRFLNPLRLRTVSLAVPLQLTLATPTRG